MAVQQFSKDVRRERNTRNFFKKFPDEGKCFEEVESHVNERPKFGIRENVTTFYFKCPLNEDAENNFRQIIDRLIHEAKQKESPPGWKIERISISLYCNALTDPVMVPVRPLNQVTSDVVFNEFMRRQQSFREVNLLSE